MDSSSSSSAVGFLDVFVHEARDIQNICIYHKQDVYAKLWLTAGGAGAAAAASTRTVNGGGRNPVFNQSLRLAVVGAAEPQSAVRCEVWMLSRVRNYLDDQLLGFALVPLSDVLAAAGGRLAEEEFSLSSTDLSHSPSGFIRLSIDYSGPSPPDAPVSPPAKPCHGFAEGDGTPPRGGLDRVEFPDLKVANENKMMVSEYFGIPCSDPESPMCPDDDGDDDCPNHEAGVRVVESFAAATCPEPPADDVSEEEEEEECALPAPVVNIDVAPQHSVVQQDIVDMYTKSMLQFTESLAKMKLPMDIENHDDGDGDGNRSADDNSNGSGGGGGDSGAGQKLLAWKRANSRVFYGSRAFF